MTVFLECAGTLEFPADDGVGVWLSRDPLGEDGGVNLYGFCDNDPVNSVDPLGLAPTWQVVRVRGDNYSSSRIGRWGLTTYDLAVVGYAGSAGVIAFAGAEADRFVRRDLRAGAQAQVRFYCDRRGQMRVAPGSRFFHYAMDPPPPTVVIASPLPAGRIVIPHTPDTSTYGSVEAVAGIAVRLSGRVADVAYASLATYKYRRIV